MKTSRLQKAYLHPISNKHKSSMLLLQGQAVTKFVIGTVFMQYFINKGLQFFGECGVDSIMKELQQLTDRKVLKAVRAADLTRQQKKDALE